MHVAALIGRLRQNAPAWFSDGRGGILRRSTRVFLPQSFPREVVNEALALTRLPMANTSRHRWHVGVERARSFVVNIISPAEAITVCRMTSPWPSTDISLAIECRDPTVNALRSQNGGEFGAAGRDLRRSQLGDQHQDFLEHLSRHRDLGHLKGRVPSSHMIHRWREVDSNHRSRHARDTLDASS